MAVARAAEAEAPFAGQVGLARGAGERARGLGQGGGRHRGRALAGPRLLPGSRRRRAGDPRLGSGPVRPRAGAGEGRAAEGRRGRELLQHRGQGQRAGAELEGRACVGCGVCGLHDYV